MAWFLVNSRRHGPAADCDSGRLFLADDGVPHGKVDSSGQLDPAVVHVLVDAGAEVCHTIGELGASDLTSIATPAAVILVYVVGVLVGRAQHHHLRKILGINV